ncbi:MAG: amidohydrolase family protein [Sphaerochaetaceae bacterium]
MADTLFVNATLIQSGEEISITSNVDVAVCDTLIVEVGKHLKQRYPHFQIIDCTDKLLVPGFVCSHHHYYSALSRGMLVSSGPQNDFIQVLKEWWWRLDRALDEEAIYYSSLICSLDAIKAGTTSCIDHHASPSCIPRSLTTIAEGCVKSVSAGARVMK